jgi:hypothetical protein
MASVATVVTMGYGSFGSIADIVSLGYARGRTDPGEDTTSSRRSLYLHGREADGTHRLPSRWKGMTGAS